MTHEEHEVYLHCRSCGEKNQISGAMEVVVTEEGYIGINCYFCHKTVFVTKVNPKTLPFKFECQECK